MKNLFLITLSVVLVSCQNLTKNEYNYVTSEYYLYSIKKDGTENQEIIRLNFFPRRISISSDSQKVLIIGGDNYFYYELNTNHLHQLDIDCSHHYPSPVFSKNSEKILYSQENKIVILDIESQISTEIAVNNVFQNTIFSANDQNIVYTKLDTIRNEEIVSINQINIDGSNNQTIYSYVLDFFPPKRYCFITISSKGELFFNENGILSKIDMSSLYYKTLNIKIDNYPLNISPDGSLILAQNNRILLISTDGMDVYPILVGEYGKFLNNHQLIYYTNYNEIWISDWDGSDRYKLADGRFFSELDENDRIYYLFIKEIYD